MARCKLRAVGYGVKPIGYLVFAFPFEFSRSLPVSNNILVIRPSYSGRMELETLSPSRAADFKACPQLFKFRSVDKLPEPITTAQARGTAAHLALQHLFDLGSEERTPERLYDLFRVAWSELRGAPGYSELFESEVEERRWGIESLTLLANYFSIEDPRQLEPVRSEWDMLGDLDGIVIRGILDRLDREGDRLVITDYKTGRPPPERYALGSFFALKIYALLVRNELGETPTELRLMYLNGPVVYRLEIDESQLAAMDRQLRALWDRIQEALDTGRFPPRPGKLCGWCTFADRCPAFVAREDTG